MSILTRMPDDEGTALARTTRHESDLYGWVQEQVALLRSGVADALDLDNIAEELSDVGAEQYDKLESAVEVTLAHMLKWDHQPKRRSRSWALSIEEHRLRAQKQLRKNSSLKSRSEEFEPEVPYRRSGRGRLPARQAQGGTGDQGRCKDPSLHLPLRLDGDHDARFLLER